MTNENIFFEKMKEWGFKPLVADFYVQQVWPLFSFERIFAKVVRKEQLNSQLVTLTLKPNFNFKKFQPGQHILLTTDVKGRRYSRTYSPTLTPKGHLQITVKKQPQGKVSSQIYDALVTGSIVEISQSFGEMTWSQLPLSKHYTFCAGGIGITPLRSLIQAWTQEAPLQVHKSIDLHYWARTGEELSFREELLEFAKEHPQLKVYFYTTRSETAGARTLRLSDSLFGYSETVFVACGPESFVQEVEKIARSKGQRFCGEHASEGLSRVTDKTLSKATEDFFDITYNGQIVQGSSQQTILESLEASGLKPAHGCRMGICKSCTCLKVDGQTMDMKNQRISMEPDEEIQICISKPQTKVTIKGY